MSWLKEELRAVAQRVRLRGEELKNDAAHTGGWSDNGGGALIAEADAFDAGLDGRLPDGWEEYAEEYRREKDPEWQEYQRLKKKFKEAE